MGILFPEASQGWTSALVNPVQPRTRSEVLPTRPLANPDPGDATAPAPGVPGQTSSSLPRWSRPMSEDHKKSIPERHDAKDEDDSDLYRLECEMELFVQEWTDQLLRGRALLDKAGH